MAKQLRLDVAQLTDVGRKREHNEDNMAYVIPKDPQVMAKKGALFIVADGMGGHAAGEVASEIAVDTISNVYYQDDSDEVTVSLLHAIKRANTLIHQRAAENMLRSGMGTTCVAAVLRGNMAYIANVGDSRAYLVRGGQVKQVSQDHSWVAEQVRAGLLTEDQARTHAQRNVITRCLGTQSDVEVDVFPESLEEKDSLVLCTDGLSGLISDEEIQRIVNQSAPQESVYHLVERANENGGPDNITAIVIAVQEVGVEPPAARHPVYVGSREADASENTATLGLPPSGSAAPAMFRTPSAPLRLTSGPLLSPDEIATAPQPALEAPQGRRSRLFYPTLALLILFLIATVVGAGYLYFRTTTNTNVDQSLRNAQGLITNAEREASSNPTAALHDLASAQTTLRMVQQSGSLSSEQRKKLESLRGKLITEVQQAIGSYNRQQGISELCSSNATASPINEGTTGTQAKSLALVQGKSTTIPPTLYALGSDSRVYQVSNNSLIPLSVAALANFKVLDLAAAGSQLVVLLSQPTTDGISYSLGLLSPGQTKLDATTQIDPSLIKQQLVPKLIAASVPDVYVVLASTANQTSVRILDYFPKGRSALAQSSQSTISASESIVSLTALPNHQLFFLLASGQVQSLQFVEGNQETTSVLVQQPLAQPLPVSANAFTAQTPVPTAMLASGGQPSLAVPGATSPNALGSGTADDGWRLYVMDANLHRILAFKPLASAMASTETSTVTATPTNTGGQAINATPPLKLQLVRQYTSSSLLAQMKAMALDLPHAQVRVLTQNASLSDLLSFSTNSPDGCV